MGADVGLPASLPYLLADSRECRKEKKMDTAHLLGDGIGSSSFKDLLRVNVHGVPGPGWELQSFKGMFLHAAYHRPNLGARRLEWSEFQSFGNSGMFLDYRVCVRGCSWHLFIISRFWQAKHVVAV